MNEAETRRVISLVSGLDNPDLPRHMEHYNSSCGDPVIFTMVPSEIFASLNTYCVYSFVFPVFHCVGGEWLHLSRCYI